MIKIINKVYIVDYDSVTYIGNGRDINKEINRSQETIIYCDKKKMIQDLAELSNDKCVENIDVSISIINREQLDIQKLLNSK